MNTPAFFPLYFVGIWFGAMFVVSRLCWAPLAREFARDGQFRGERLGTFNGRINGITYKNGLSMQFNEDGIYMRPVLIMRLFHRPVFIPWRHWEVYKVKTLFGLRPYQLYLYGPATVSVFLSEYQAEQLRKYIWI